MKRHMNIENVHKVPVYFTEIIVTFIYLFIYLFDGCN
jgi:hypothetical protein